MQLRHPRLGVLSLLPLPAHSEALVGKLDKDGNVHGPAEGLLGMRGPVHFQQEITEVPIGQHPPQDSRGGWGIHRNTGFSESRST